MRRRGIRWLLLFLLLGACTSKTSERIAEQQSGRGDIPYPVDESSIRGPGHPLLGGFQVAEGTWLLGAAFPRHVVVNIPADERTNRAASQLDVFGWDAVLALIGGAEEAVQRYLEQAASVGFPAESQESRCAEESGTMTCDGFATRSGETEQTEVLLEIRAVAGGVIADTEYPQAFVHIHVDGLEDPPEPRATSDRPDDEKPNYAGGKPSQEGERFGGNAEKDRPARQTPSFKVAPGSRLVAPPYTEEHAIPAPVQYAVVRITGSKDAALADYQNQARAYYPRIARDEGFTVNGAAVSESTMNCPGGCGFHEARSIVQGEQTFLLLKSSPRS